MVASTPLYLSISAQKQADRDSLISAEWKIPLHKLPPPEVLDITDFPNKSGLLTPKEIQITETCAAQLVSKMTSPGQDRWSSLEVVTAFCKRASIAQQLVSYSVRWNLIRSSIDDSLLSAPRSKVNCLTEICFEEALSTAKALDLEFGKTGVPKGPLHGLPISIKDHFKIKGLDSTLGFSCWSVSAPFPPFLYKIQNRLPEQSVSRGADLVHSHSRDTGQMIQ